MKDSEREEDPPAERFSKITPFEPALKAVGEKPGRRPALRVLSRMCAFMHTSNWVVPRSLRPFM